jgi:hypothetical protein
VVFGAVDNGESLQLSMTSFPPFGYARVPVGAIWQQRGRTAAGALWRRRGVLVGKVADGSENPVFAAHNDYDEK